MAGVLKVLLMAILLIQLDDVLGKKFSRCQFVRQLKSHGLTSNLKDWACLAEHESGLETNKIGRPNRNKSVDYGIFQACKTGTYYVCPYDKSNGSSDPYSIAKINNKYWCREGVKGGDCNIKCEDLRNGDISDDIECAKKIYRRHGFQAWVAWRNKCQNKKMSEVSSC